MTAPRAIQLEHLAEAERHIGLGSSHIERQEQIVADIDSQRRDGTAARELLRALRQMQDQYVAHRDRILHWRSNGPPQLAVLANTGSPLHDRDGVIRFQHRRKISSILIRNTVVPIAIRTTLGSCLAIERVKSPKTRSCYEYHPPGRSKTVRTAVGRSIFPADGIGRTSKPAAGEGEPADRRARQEQKKNPPG